VQKIFGITLSVDPFTPRN